MKVLILTNHQLGLYKFRRELLERLVSDHHEVYVSVPEDRFTEDFKKLGVMVLINECLDRRGTNPVKDLKLAGYYRTILKKIKPDVVLTYTIKPNVYGGLVCGRYRIPYIANVTGLGTAIHNGGLMQKVPLFLYRMGLKKADKVFFQNKADHEFMLEHNVVKKQVTDILPGSGVNTDQFAYRPYPDESNGIIFTTIGRIMKDKGIDEILAAAEVIRNKYPNTFFRLIGDFDEGYEKKIKELDERGIIEYLGFKEDVRDYVSESHAILHASYHEGMSNVLLEAASMGRPVIATDVPGCIDTYDPGVSGIPFKAQNSQSLINAVEEFLSLSMEQKEAMGRAGREKMEKEFSRKIVIEKYLDNISKVG